MIYATGIFNLKSMTFAVRDVHDNPPRSIPDGVSVVKVIEEVGFTRRPKNGDSLSVKWVGPLLVADAPQKA